MTSCTICLENIDSNRFFLECTHSFHRNCIERWFHNDNTCPVCRIRINHNPFSNIPTSPSDDIPTSNIRSSFHSNPRQSPDPIIAGGSIGPSLPRDFLMPNLVDSFNSSWHYRDHFPSIEARRIFYDNYRRMIHDPDDDPLLRSFRALPSESRRNFYDNYRRMIHDPDPLLRSFETTPSESRGDRDRERHRHIRYGSQHEDPLRESFRSLHEAVSRHHSN